jgi:hypothetical protein
MDSKRNSEDLPITSSKEAANYLHKKAKKAVLPQPLKNLEATRRVILLVERLCWS